MNYRKIFYITTTGLLIFFLAPLFFGIISAQESPIVGSTGIWKGTQCAANSPTGGPTEACGFCDAIVVTTNIITYLWELCLIIAVGMIVYGALRLVLSAGSPKNIEAGKKAITLAITGLAIALGAWIIINTLLSLLTGNPTFKWWDVQC